MWLAKTLLNKRIVSVSDGRILGRVHEVYLDQDLTRVAGLHVGYEGLIDRTAKFVHRDSIELFGEDTVLVRHSDAVLDESENEVVRNWLRRDKLSGRDIDTPGGTKIGTVGDVVLADAGEVIGFTLGRSYVDSPVTNSGAVSRNVVIDTGAQDHAMTIDLKKAEQEDFRLP